MAGCVETVRHLGCAAVHHAAHRLAVQTTGKHVELLDQCGEDRARIEQVDRDEMVRHQYAAEGQILVHPIAEDSQGNALPSRRAAMMPHCPARRDPVSGRA